MRKPNITEAQVFEALLQTSPGAAAHFAEVAGSFQRKIVATNGKGTPVGEDHHRAKLTNHDIDLIIELRKQGMLLKFIADKFEVSESYVCEICAEKKRVSVAIGQRVIWRFVPSNPGGSHTGE